MSFLVGQLPAPSRRANKTRGDIGDVATETWKSVIAMTRNYEMVCEELIGQVTWHQRCHVEQCVVLKIRGDCQT